MSNFQTSENYYFNEIDLRDVNALEVKLNELLQSNIQSTTDLVSWLEKERELIDEIQEAISGHRIDFYRDTMNTEKRNIYIYDQSVIQPVLLKYQAKLDAKFCSCPFTTELSDGRFGAIKRVRVGRQELFCEENIPLMVREKQLGAKYTEIRGAMSVAWDGELRPYSQVRALLEQHDRAIRERAWRAMAQARSEVKRDVDELFSELIQLRHKMALNAGFENYRDYMFLVKSREYTAEDCSDIHQSVVRHIVPCWNRLANIFRSELGVESYHPWDSTAKMLPTLPYSTVTELMDGVEEMLGRTDSSFRTHFKFMRERGLLDVECRHGKQIGGFMDPLPASKNAFIFANFSPSFDAIIALIHEMGHALNSYLSGEFHEEIWRAEVAELYSHGTELLLLDKLDIFYPKMSDFKKAQREELRRALGLLIGPVTRDVFEHWMYTNANHTTEERDEKFVEITKQFKLSPEYISGLEVEIASSFMDTPHFFLHPFYSIEYSISQLGALRLLEIYRSDSDRAIDLYKQGASISLNCTIADIYQQTGIEFDFSEGVVQRTGEFLESVLNELQ